MKNTLALFFASLFGTSVFSQSLPVGTPILENAWRRSQLKSEKDLSVSFIIRPIISSAGHMGDTTALLLPAGEKIKLSLANGSGVARLLPLTVRQQHNSHHPYGWNDGSLIPANGYQAQISAGVFASLGPVSLQLQPEFVYAQNTAFTLLLKNRSDSFRKTFFHVVTNSIDAPEQFGTKSFWKLFPGQSSLRFNVKKWSFGISTENLWWGPGVRNSLIMSNTAPGFPHLTLNTTAPITSPIGSFEGQLIGGWLEKSGFLPDTLQTLNGEKLAIEKPAGTRYLNGMVITWQPKWMRGLHLGFSRAFYLYHKDQSSSIDSYLPVIGRLFKSDAGTHEDSLRDQLFSVFFRLILPNEKAEVYGEFGRNDHSANMRDLLLEPEHSRAYLFGFRKLFQQNNNTDLELMAEFSNLQLPSTMFLREQGSWYAHSVVCDGYTNQGQVIGAGIGPGSNSQTIGLHWLNGIASKGFLLERVVHNNDFYYAAFSPQRDFGSHWVDLSINLNKSWQHKNFLYDARLSLVKSLNYQWRKGDDVHFLQAGFTASYLF